MRTPTKSLFVAVAGLCGTPAIISPTALLAHPANVRLESGSPSEGKAGLNPGQAESDRPSAPALGAKRGREPKPKYPTSVTISLRGIPNEDDKDLARAIQKVLEREQPENPGRRATFGKMFLLGLTPQNRETHVLKQVGWYLVIHEVDRLPDGWRATVHVQILATKLNNYPAAVDDVPGLVES